MLIKIFERNLLTVIGQVRSISEVIDSADEEELPPPPQEQVGHHLHHHHHQYHPPPQEQVGHHHHHQQQIKDILLSTVVYIIINHNNIMFQHVSLAKVFGNITPTTSITSIMESIILKNRKYCHLAILQPPDINYHAHLFQMLANVRKGLPMATETDL